MTACNCDIQQYDLFHCFVTRLIYVQNCMRPSEVIGMKRAGFSVNLLFVPQKEGLLIASFYQHHNNYFTLRVCR